MATFSCSATAPNVAFEAAAEMDDAKFAEVLASLKYQFASRREYEKDADGNPLKNEDDTPRYIELSNEMALRYAMGRFLNDLTTKAAEDKANNYGKPIPIEPATWTVTK